MTVQTIGSGSSGNAYCIKSGTQSILLDCGLPIKKIQIGLNFQCSSLSGCLITHSHGDHNKAAKDLLKLGVDIYAGKETLEATGVSGHHVHPMEKMLVHQIGEFLVMPLEVKHDVPTFAYLLAHNGKRLLYITDAQYFPYEIAGVTHLMIEANHDTDVIMDNAQKGLIHESLAKRIVRSHMSIKSCLKMISMMDKSKFEEIWLLHLSQDNSNAEDFLRKVRALTGCIVHVAE